MRLIKSSLKGIQGWRSRRQLRSLQRWERIRAEGKGRFVFRTALGYGLAVVGVTDVLNHLFDGGTEPSISLVKLIFFMLVGIFMGSDAWSSMEAKYQDALRKARVNALPESKK